VSGLSHKKLKEPSEIIIERRKFRSIISPKIKPSNKGAIGKANRRNINATKATPTIINKSNVLNDTKYTPIKLKNKIIMVNTDFGIANTFAK